MIKLPYHKEDYKVDREAFEQVVKEVEATGEINCTQLGAIFGTPFWQLMLLVLIDGREALLKQVVKGLDIQV